MKIKNLLFILMIALIGFIGMNKVNAAENYGLFVNGEEFTSEKTTINCGDGTAVFNPETITLTLNDATITKGYKIPESKERDQGVGVVGIYYDSGIVYDEDYDPEEPKNLDNLTIVLNGTNTINISVFAMLLEANVTIEGEGKLDVNLSVTSQFDNDFSALIPAVEIWGDLSINNTEFNISVPKINYSSEYDWGPTMVSAHLLNIINSKVSITGCFGTAITVNTANISDSNVNIDVNGNIFDKDYTVAIWSYEGDLTVRNNSTVNVNAEYGLVAREYLFQEEGMSNKIVLYDGDYTLVGTSEALAGNLNLSNFNGKIMAGWYEDGQNVDLISKSELLNNNYYSYIKMGNFETYAVTNKSTNNMIEMPKQAYEGEKIEFYDGWYEGLYEIANVQILKTSDNTDVTSEVGYKKEDGTHTIIMPAYPITVKITLKVTYAAVPKTISAKLDKYNAIKVSWTRDDSNYNNYFTGAYVYYKKSTDTKWIKIGWTAKLNYTKTNLEPGVKYNFKIVPLFRIYNQDDKLVNVESTKYKLINIYTLKKMNLPTITKYSNSKVQVKWKRVEGATKYQIARSVYKTRNYSIVKTVGSGYIGFKVDTKANKTYYYKVRACRGDVCAPWSNYKSFRLQ